MSHYSCPIGIVTTTGVTRIGNSMLHRLPIGVPHAGRGDPQQCLSDAEQSPVRVARSSVPLSPPRPAPRFCGAHVVPLRSPVVRAESSPWHLRRHAAGNGLRNPRRGSRQLDRDGHGLADSALRSRTLSHPFVSCSVSYFYAIANPRGAFARFRNLLPTLTNALVLPEAVRSEFERSAIFGDDSDYAVGSTRRHGCLNLERYLHVGSHETN